MKRKAVWQYLLIKSGDFPIFGEIGEIGKIKGTQLFYLTIHCSCVTPVPGLGIGDAFIGIDAGSAGLEAEKSCPYATEAAFTGTPGNRCCSWSGCSREPSCR